MPPLSSMVASTTTPTPHTTSSRQCAWVLSVGAVRSKSGNGLKGRTRISISLPTVLDRKSFGRVIRLQEWQNPSQRPELHSRFNYGDSEDVKWSTGKKGNGVFCHHTVFPSLSPALYPPRVATSDIFLAP